MPIQKLILVWSVAESETKSVQKLNHLPFPDTNM